MEKDIHRPENKHFLMLIVLVLGFAAITCAIIFMPKPEITVTGTGSGSDIQRNTISVVGENQFETEPDEAVLYIKVMTEKPTAKTAQTENAKLMNTIMAALENAGVDKSDMESTNYNMYRKQDWNPTTQKYDYGDYVVQHLLKVTTADVLGVGDLLDTAVKAGANGLDNVQFQLSDTKQEQVNDQALKAAAGKAKEKADSIASSIGVKLGDIVTVSESNVGYTPYYYPRYAMAEAAMDSKAGGGTEISPQSVQVSATVSIVYKIK